MRIPLISLMILTFFTFTQIGLQAQTVISTVTLTVTATNTVTTTTAINDKESAAIQQEKDKIALEQLQLQDAQLKLKLIQAQQQLTPTSPTPTPQPMVKNSDQMKQELEDFKLAESKKAEALAKEAKDKGDVFILDLVNAEFWYKGIRYGAFELNHLAEDQHWKTTKTIDERDPAGHARYLYTYQNASLLKYENSDGGIFSINQAMNTGDMDFLTPEGLSLRSSTGDVRDNEQNLYFKYDGQGSEKGQKILRYVSPENFLGFNEQLEFWFDHHDKLTKIRYGLLGQK